jgi:hypothetical protein
MMNLEKVMKSKKKIKKQGKGKYCIKAGLRCGQSGIKRLLSV